MTQYKERLYKFMRNSFAYRHGLKTLDVGFYLLTAISFKLLCINFNVNAVMHKCLNLSYGKFFVMEKKHPRDSSHLNLTAVVDKS